MTDQLFEVQTAAQLKILSEINAISAEIGCEFWLRGGWAIDFFLGRVTRAHDDIDLVTWIQHREKLERALADVGYKQTPVKEEFHDRQSDFCKDDVEVTFSYITRTSEGSLIMNRLLEWVWRADSLLPQEYLLNGISARVLNPRQLLEEKEVYEQIGRTPRSKDAESKIILNRIIAELI